jgi:CubicO group peptidase (beta-lactamase class C family)
MKMRSRRLRGMLAVFFLLGFATACPAQEKTDWSSLDASINSSMKDWKVPGAAVAIVRDQSVVYMKGFGVREMGKSDTVTPDTLFDIGSCTKAFTSAAIAILVDEEKCSGMGR